MHKAHRCQQPLPFVNIGFPRDSSIVHQFEDEIATPNHLSTSTFSYSQLLRATIKVNSPTLVTSLFRIAVSKSLLGLRNKFLTRLIKIKGLALVASTWLFSFICWKILKHLTFQVSFITIKIVKWFNWIHLYFCASSIYELNQSNFA